MARVKAEYKLKGKWKSKILHLEIPRNKLGFTLTLDLCKVATEELKRIISPDIEFRKVQILSV